MQFRLDLILDLKLKWNGFSQQTVSLAGGLGGLGATPGSRGATRIRYFEKKGDGSTKAPILFVHGIGATASHFADAMIFMARAGYPVYAADLPGHGLSSDPPDGLNGDSLLREFSSWVKKVMPPRPFVLIGNSLGGGLSLKYATLFPGRVKKLVLLSPAVAFQSEDQWVDFRKTLRFSTVEESRQYLERIFHKPPFYLGLLKYSTWKAFNRKGVKNLLATAQARDFKLPSGFKEELAPTLVIWGQSEKVFPHSHLEWIRKRFPKTTVVEEPEGVGHCPQLDSPQWFKARLLEFVEKR